MTSAETVLCAFLARIIGYERTDAIEAALRSLALYVAGRAALVLLGDTDLVPVALTLHERTVGAERPFVVCDPRRTHESASVRVPASRAVGVAAVRFAHGGTVCLRRRRLPDDLLTMAALVRDPTADVRAVIVAETTHASDPFLLLPAPILIPPLGSRTNELGRVVDEYAADAIDALDAEILGLHETDRAWVLKHAAGSLPEIETTTLRLVALRAAGSIAGAAKRLGMSHVALGYWLRNRGLNRRGEARP